MGDSFIIKNDIDLLIEKYQKPQSIMRFINVESLKESYHRQLPSDIKYEYGKDLDANIEELLRRMKKFSYFPQSKDWSQIVNADRDSKKEKCIYRLFEDGIVQDLFKEILDSVFEYKINHRKMNSNNMSINISFKPFSESGNYIFKVNTLNILKNIDHEILVDLVKGSIADRRFVLYFERFLISGTKLLQEYYSNTAISISHFISMMDIICEYYAICQKDKKSILCYEVKGVKMECQVED